MRHIKLLLLSVATGFLIIVGVASLGVYEYFMKPKPVVVEPVEEKKLTFIEGWTVADYAGYLEKRGVIVKSLDFYNVLDGVDRSKYVYINSVPKVAKLEGFLFPDTYRIFKDTKVGEVVVKLLENFERRFKEAGANVDADGKILIPGYGKFSVMEVVTLASIVEKETGIDLTKLGTDQKKRLLEERKVVAGIFLNRLKINQALESDATINYVTGKNHASSTFAELDMKSSYNTYRNLGLPSGPICNPSLSSLEAVLNPTKTDYFYFLHKQPSGEVVYSKTFQEHINNKNRFLK